MVTNNRVFWHFMMGLAAGEALMFAVYGMLGYMLLTGSITCAIMVYLDLSKLKMKHGKTKEDDSMASQ